MRPHFLLVLLTAISCTTSSEQGGGSVKGYAIARAALKAAKTYGADSKASDYYQKAVHAYEKGEKFYKSGRYFKASRAFNQARMLAEQAENIARDDNNETGADSLPQ